jgi:hypothetical protein
LRIGQTAEALSLSQSIVTTYGNRPIRKPDVSDTVSLVDAVLKHSLSSLE